MVSENRCMMCGKDNPPELEECQYCQARLKPLIINQPEQSIDRAEAVSPIPAEKQESDPIDWLKDLRPSDIELEEEPASDQEPWNDNVFEQAETDTAKDEQDWLADLRVDSGGLPDLSGDDEASWDNDVEDSGEFFDEQIPEDRIPPAHADQASPATPIEGDGQKAEPSLDEDAPEWLQQIRSLHKTEQESSLSEGDSESEEPFDIEWDDHRELVEQIDAQGAPDGTSPIPPDDIVPDNGEENLAETTSELIDSFDNLDLQVVDELPDWLSSESKANDVGEALDELEPLSADEAEDKSALSGVDDHFAGLVGSLTPAADTDIERGTPEWLSERSVTDDAEQGEEDLISSSEDVPDWLAALEKSTPDIPPISFKGDDDGADLGLDWVEEDTLTENILAVGEASDVLELPPQIDDAELFEGELTDLGDEDFISQLDLEESVADDSDAVEQAELPIWMESMKPVEAVAPEIDNLQTEESQVEVSGPLAGLQGVLPAEPEIAHYMKPAVGSVKLNILEKQHAQIAILDEMIQREEISVPIPDQPTVTSQSIFRVVIFSILFAIIGWTVFVGSQSQPLPVFPPEVFSVNSVVNNIPPGAPVLLAVDYEIGLSAEMEAASAALLDHLMIRGAYLTIVSTTTTGPAQAEHLIDTVNVLSEHQYSNPGQYTILGYIPGGHSGLFAFAQAPRQVLPYSITGDHVWERDPLAAISNLEQFALTAVLTEDPDKARAWIEQVQPRLGEKPLIMALSAQAEPVVRPYYDNQSNQLRGFVSGLSGGASYEALLNRSGLGRIYWDAFTRASVAGVVLIIITGLVYVLVPKMELPSFRTHKGEE